MKYEECVRILVNKTDIDLSVRCGEDNSTVLHQAALAGSLVAVQILIEKGSVIDETNSVGFAALISFAYFGVNLFGWQANYTALHFAAMLGHIQVVRFLVDCGAPVEARAQVCRVLICIMILNEESLNCRKETRPCCWLCVASM